MFDLSDELAGWPMRDRSRRIDVRPHRWHVQEAGDGPLLLLLHGTGGATHSWRDLMPDLARDHRVVALDLPGHGFTRLGSGLRSGLRPMAEDIARLAASQGWQPTAIVGHSAGGALALALSERLTTAEGTQPAVIGINAALEPFDGMAGVMLPMMAKLLALNPFVPGMFALSSGTPDRVRQLIEGTGSHLDAEGLALYARLLGDPRHVAGALRMMAEWTLEPLVEAMPRIAAPTTLIVGAGDRAVPPETSDRAADRLPNARVARLPGLGHLAHEEAPATVAARMREALA